MTETKAGQTQRKSYDIKRFNLALLDRRWYFKYLQEGNPSDFDQSTFWSPAHIIEWKYWAPVNPDLAHGRTEFNVPLCSKTSLNKWSYEGEKI